MKKTLDISILLSAALVLVTPAFGSDTETGRIMHANDNNPGAAIDLNSVLSHRFETLLFIHSPHCGPCKRISPKIKKLASVKTDLKIVDMLLDRKNDPNGIGWDSAAAKQFDIHVVPTFIIFDANGKQISRGEVAKATVDNWLIQAGIKKD